MARAPRLLLRAWQASARGALLAACLWSASPDGAAAQSVVAARYTEPTERYAHGVLGDAIEWGALEITLDISATTGSKVDLVKKTEIRTFLVELDHVFEDVAPRLADVDGDGNTEVIVVETDVNVGAALAIYGPNGKITETPHIGTRNRWLAPLGAADLDGDGVTELAYVDRPHLAKTLRIWRYADGALTEVGSLPGLTNHRIGEADIAGGIRDCGEGPEMVLATGNWSDLIAVRWGRDGFDRRNIGDDTTRPAFARAMACE